MNTAQYKAAYAILNKTGLAAQKENIVMGITAGRTSSMRELSAQESIALIKYLNEQQPAHEDKRAKMTGKIFYYCHQMGWVRQNKAGRTVADGQRFNAWALKSSYLKKKLNQYSYAELPKLVSQFEQVYKHFLKTI